ncbi:NDP-hexose 2,3-dehydratase family protein [Nocardiopsis xinjiangensis]|uniref:NDP-hexose 2,3-dehydratase family protein n=1 Tax=Nocardiopsis xinjiangensis TaxID=124285 RepID=UPI00034D5477|nr:NDP-hexose 2,3-dehydratase family protein [Nocardiopsis xinjiangensis]
MRRDGQIAQLLREAGESVPYTSIDTFHEWWNRRLENAHVSVRKVPFSELDSWGFDPDTGNLQHSSGRFFSVEGLQVRGGASPWSQPVINQSEIGVLGILVKEINGVLHCLMQAKMEPGNVNMLQLSPTVQATRSNYTKVHRGTSTRYLEYFVGPQRGQVLVDVLQSEQGAWFWCKRNRNIVVLVTEDVPLHEDYHWLSLEQVRSLARTDNLINMDARTVLSCMPFALPEEAEAVDSDPFRRALVRSYHYRGEGPESRPLHTVGDILSWFIEAKSGCDWSARLVPLKNVTGWRHTQDEITDDQHFRIIGVEVESVTREVQQWSQPLLQPYGQGRALFLARPINGILHLLVQAHEEPGLLDQVEMAPTVHLLPGADESVTLDPFVRDALASDSVTVHYDQVLSEEGGRFHQALTRYQIMEVGDDVPTDVPPNYCWMTVRQLFDLLRHGHYLNIEARSLIACLHSLH